MESSTEHQKHSHNLPIPSNGIITIRTPHLHLRTIQIRDAAAHFRLNTTPVNIEYEPHSDPTHTIPWYETNMAKNRRTAAAGKNNFMSVCLPVTSDETIIDGEVTKDEVIGMCGYNVLYVRASTGETVANTGVMIDAPFTRKGYGIETFKALVSYAFEVLGVDVVEFETQEVNVKFLAMAQALEITEMGILGGEEGRREWVWNLKRREWEELKANWAR